MARKYEIAPGRYAWGFAWAEEQVLIFAYCDIYTRISSGERGFQYDFEDNFFTRGNGMSFDHLTTLNAIRRRYQLPALFFEETDIDEYGKDPYNKPERAERRCNFRTELATMRLENASKLWN
jgi:hypothetical protein